MRHAVAEYDVNAGLTLSENQRPLTGDVRRGRQPPPEKRCETAGWGEFDEPVDRIVSPVRLSISADGAGDAGLSYQIFFKKFYNLTPDDGRMLLHTITILTKRKPRSWA